MAGIVSETITADKDEHIFILIAQEDLPPLSIDIGDKHGRRILSLRVEGMTVATILADVKELDPIDGQIQRFCPYCGEQLNILSSVDRHVCL